MTIDIPLPVPVEVDGRVITSITLRPPTLEDQVKSCRPEAGRYVRGARLVARVTGLSTYAVSAMMKANDDVCDQIEAYLLPYLG